MSVFVALMAVDVTSARAYNRSIMKLTSIVWRSLVGVACMSFVFSAAAAGENNKPGYREWRGVVYTKVTGSLIPERVVLRGNTVNSASPLTIIQGNELHSNGRSEEHTSELQ